MLIVIMKSLDEVIIFVAFTVLNLLLVDQIYPRIAVFLMSLINKRLGL